MMMVKEEQYPTSGCADVLVRLEEDDVNFGHEEAAERHRGADVDAHAQRRRLDL